MGGYHPRQERSWEFCAIPRQGLAARSRRLSCLALTFICSSASNFHQNQTNQTAARDSSTHSLAQSLQCASMHQRVSALIWESKPYYTSSHFKCGFTPPRSQSALLRLGCEADSRAYCSRNDHGQSWFRIDYSNHSESRIQVSEPSPSSHSVRA